MCAAPSRDKHPPIYILYYICAVLALPLQPCSPGLSAVLCSIAAVTRCRYTEAFVAQARSLTLERGQVEGVSIIAYDVGSAGGTVVLFCERHMLLLLLLLLPVAV